MKRSFKMLLIALSLLIIITPPAYNSGGNDSEQWVKVNEGAGIVSYGKLGSKNPTKSVYAVGIVNASVPVIEFLLRDVDAHNQYVSMVTETKKIELPGRTSTTDYFYEYCRLGMPWPVWDRDAVGSAQFMYDKVSGKLWVHIKGIKIDEYKPREKSIRMTVTNLDFKLVPKGPDSTEVTYTIEANPAIELPSFVLDMLFKTLGYNTIKNMREMVKLEKYKNAASIITTTDWKN